MFDRFTERARQVMVLAQVEARALKHNYIGTEHLLLGLIREEQGVAARVLDSLDITVEEVRAQVVRFVGQGDELPGRTTPLTPRTKKVLELSLREAMALGDNYIGTEHILLGLVRENEGVASRILLDFGADALKVRNEVIREVSGASSLPRPEVGREEPIAERWLSLDPQPLPQRLTEATRNIPFVLGWLLFAAALAVGIFVGWLIWG